ncbi:DUF4246 domain-containing protein [Aspergillus thermomutatus]|uniref:Uncharacterized protein n=1 Tax=Aspergillus thermomutatus TaxID=41047 RepID=A0A397H0W6_ASPTH|nr:uncharacterized protein CDV56_102727 [Aspergillus thermomutatus]RHZ54010.1 hypothetical protein CDV56_102727 [Aspergillus thermomutatus]
MSELTIDNKTCPLKVPGFHDIAVNVELPRNQFAAGIKNWRGSILTAKELAMLDSINTITERPDWHVRIFKQEEIARWRDDALSSSSLINDQTWSWCLKELQDKARDLEKYGRVIVLNTGSGVCKSDTAISTTLQSQLQDAAIFLTKDLAQIQYQNAQKSAVANLVDPSLFPLVYGRTKVLTGGQSCGMDEASWSSRVQECQIAPERPPFAQEDAWAHLRLGCIWSTRFQWLPCEVEFTGPPGSTDVRITSYINNLHPTNRDMYSAIEAVLASSIKQWNEILIREKWKEPSSTTIGHCNPCPREPIRIRTYGVDWKARFLEWAKKLPEQSKEDQLTAEEYEEMCAQVEAYLQQPESRDKVHWFQVTTQKIPEDWKTRWGLRRTALTKYAHMFVFEHSDPGTAYSYEDWKAGRTGEAIVGPADQENWGPVFETEQFLLSNPWLEPYRWAYQAKGQKDDDHQFYAVALQDEFREKGLQVVVKIHSIELEPDMPSFPGEDWHTEGNSNEHIVTNAIYAFDFENISEPQISFRQRLSHAGRRYVYDKMGAGDDPDDDESDFDDEEHEDDEDARIFERDPEEKYACWDLKYIGKLFGFETIQYAPAWQELGKVRMPSGRLISFPNAFQHRMGPLELQDKAKPGHCRFLTLCLVDPTYRICSTRNVPPQQPNWIDGSGSQIHLKEALKLKEELMKERAKKDEATFELAGTLVFSGVS